jgi:hypothetical protein
MRWFRDHIKQGSWLALIALVINFALVFGHVHTPDGTVRQGGATLVAAVTTPAGQAHQGQPTDSHADYLCPICVAAATVSGALAPTSPALPLEFAEARIDHAITSDLSGALRPKAAFQSRGPPIS